MASVMSYYPNKKCIRVIQLTTAFSSILAAMFALWYLSIAIDEIRKRFGWRSFSDIFSSNAAPPHKPIKNTDTDEKEEIKPVTPNDKPTSKQIEIPKSEPQTTKPEPPKFTPPKPKSPVVEKKPELPKPIEVKPVPKETPKLPEFPKTSTVPKLPEIPRIPDSPDSESFSGSEKPFFEKHTDPKLPSSNEDSFTFLQNEMDGPKLKPTVVESPKINLQPLPKVVPKSFVSEPLVKPSSPKIPELPKTQPPAPPKTQNLKFPKSAPSRPQTSFNSDYKTGEDSENLIIFNKPPPPPPVSDNNNGDSLMGDSFTFIDDSPPSINKPNVKDVTTSFLSGELSGAGATTKPKKYDHSKSSAL